MAFIWLWSRRIKVMKSIFENSFEWLLFGPKNMSNRLSGIQLRTKHSSKNNAHMCMSESAGYAAYQRSNDTYESCTRLKISQRKKEMKKKHTKQYEVSALWYRLSNKHWVALITFIDRWPNERANIHTCELTHKYTRIASIYFKSTLCRKQLFFVLSTVCPANCFVDCGCSRLQWISLNTLLNNQERENKATKRTVTDR